MTIPHQFQRTQMLLGADALTKLLTSRVAVFGVGGVGGYVCEALVRTGLGAIDLIDNDTVSETNLNRQLIALHSTMGQPKVETMKQRLLDINPDVAVTCHNLFYLPENADALPLENYDFVVDAIDTLSAKVEIAVRCQAAGVPLICAMGAGNRLDPTALYITDLYQTSGCPLARRMRSLCRKAGIERLPVCVSREDALVPDLPEDAPRCPGSTAFVPPAMGLTIAAYVVRELTKMA